MKITQFTRALKILLLAIPICFACSQDVFSQSGDNSRDFLKVKTDSEEADSNDTKPILSPNVSAMGKSKLPKNQQFVRGITLGSIFSDEQDFGLGLKLNVEYFFVPIFGVSLSTLNTYYPTAVDGELLMNWGLFMGPSFKVVNTRPYSLVCNTTIGFLRNSLLVTERIRNGIVMQEVTKTIPQTKFAFRVGLSNRFNLSKSVGINLDIDAVNAGLTEFSDGTALDIYGVMFGLGVFFTMR